MSLKDFRNTNGIKKKENKNLLNIKEKKLHHFIRKYQKTQE